jgi:hypothetical protein
MKDAGFIFGLFLGLALLVGPQAIAQNFAPRPAEAPPTEAGEKENKLDWLAPTPDSQREPTLKQWDWEFGLHAGLVGTGPTQVTNDLRWAIFDWWELRTNFAPYPASLMTRFKIGSATSNLGAFVLDGGLSYFDAGFRLVTDEGEPEVGLRAHLEAGLGYRRALGKRFGLDLGLRHRSRLSGLSNDDQETTAATAYVIWDVQDRLSAWAGLAWARVWTEGVRELGIQFTETGRPGMSVFLIREDDWLQSWTLPLAMRYSLTETFDVDLFLTPRFFPQWDALFGAGVLIRI